MAERAMARGASLRPASPLRAGAEIRPARGSRSGPARPEGGASSGARAGRVVLVLALLAAVLLLGFLLAGRAKASRWTVKAPAGIDAAALGAELERRYGDTPLLALDLSRVEKELSADPLARSVKASKLFPDSVSVTILGRKAVMAAVCESGGSSRAALVDAEGVVFSIGPGGASEDLPVLSGIKFVNPAPGARLPEAVMPLVESVASLEESGSGLLGMVSELRFVNRPGGTGECILFPMGSPVQVRLSDRITEEALKSAALILDVVKKRGLEAQVREIDLRSGAIVYKTKEG